MSVVIVLGGVLATCAVGAGVVSYLMAARAARPSSAASRAPFATQPRAAQPQELVAWESRSLTFFQGQGAEPNLVGVASFGDRATALVGVSGADGKLLWRVPSGICDIYTDGLARIVRFETGKTLTGYDARTGRTKWSLRLTDNIRGLAFGQGCANVRLTMSQTLIGIDTETGKATNCNADEPTLPRRSAIAPAYHGGLRCRTPALGARRPSKRRENSLSSRCDFGRGYGDRQHTVRGVPGTRTARHRGGDPGSISAAQDLEGSRFSFTLALRRGTLTCPHCVKLKTGVLSCRGQGHERTLGNSEWPKDPHFQPLRKGRDVTTPRSP